MKKQFFKVWMTCMLMGFPFMAWAQTNETLVATYSLTRYVDDSPGDEDDGSPEYPWRTYIPYFDASVYQDGHHYRIEWSYELNDEEHGGPYTMTESLADGYFYRNVERIPIGDGGEYTEEYEEYFEWDVAEGVYLEKPHITPIYEYDELLGQDVLMNPDEVSSWKFEYWVGHPLDISNAEVRVYEMEE